MKKMKIEIGDFCIASMKVQRPEPKTVRRHVEVIRPIGVNGWEVVSTHTPTERYVVTADQLELESDAVRASREEAWRRWGRPS